MNTVSVQPLPLGDVENVEDERQKPVCQDRGDECKDGVRDARDDVEPICMVEWHISRLVAYPLTVVEQAFYLVHGGKMR